MHFVKIFFSGIIFLIPIFSQEEENYDPVDFPKNYIAQLNAVYVSVGSWEGKLDIYRPSASTKPTPVVINIHGGGWARGVKESQRGFGSFFKNGWAVVNIAYRLSPVAPAPAAIEDARCALMYVIKHSKELNIDTKKIVMMGGSAGGHLALMAGLLGNNHLFDTQCPGVEGINVAAIIDKYGVTDLSNSSGLQKNKSARTWIGSNINNNEFLQSISPISYVTKRSPPIFIVHGESDPTVPYQQSVVLKKKLDEAGVRNYFMTVSGGVHGKFSKEQNSEMSSAIWNFLKENGIAE